MSYKRTRMFRNLRLRLTIINVVIMLGLFLLLGAGVYFFSQADMERRSTALAYRIMEDIRAGRLTDLPRRHEPPPPAEAPLKIPPGALPHRPGAEPGPAGLPPPGPPGPPELSFFFIKLDSAGRILYRSSGSSLDTAQLSRLADAALEMDSALGPLELDGTRYTFFKTALEDPPGTLLLFRDLTSEITMRQTLMTALLAVGLVCSLLSFGASFYMANRAMVPIQQAWQQQRNFLSDASHELRTPLAVIQTNLEVLCQDPHETVGRQSYWLDNIREEAACMAALVDSLLFLARADSSQQPVNKGFFTFAHLLKRAVSPFEAVAAAKGVSLVLEAPPSLEGYGDELQLKRLFGILIDNAIRHTSAGGFVQVTAARTAGGVQIRVADSGEGIPAEHLEKIFDRFYQVDTSRNKGGAGLGLAIARWIAESHDGSIAAVSVPGRHTVFIVDFPQKRFPPKGGDALA